MSSTQINLLIVTKHRKILKKGVVVKLDGASLDGADQIRLRPISVLHLARLDSPRRSNQNGRQSVDIQVKSRRRFEKNKWIFAFSQAEIEYL